jgi:hypothetical protein
MSDNRTIRVDGIFIGPVRTFEHSKSSKSSKGSKKGTASWHGWDRFVLLKRGTTVGSRTRDGITPDELTRRTAGGSEPDDPRHEPQET